MIKAKNQAGFAALEAFLFLVIVVIIGGAAYYVGHASKKTNSIYSSTSKASVSTNQYTGWKSFCSNAGGICLKYPSNWSLDHQTFSLNDSPTPETDKITSPSGNTIVSYDPDSIGGCTGGNDVLNVINVKPVAKAKGLETVQLTQTSNDPSSTGSGYQPYYVVVKTGQTAADNAQTPFTTDTVIKSTYEPTCYSFANPNNTSITGKQQLEINYNITGSQRSDPNFNPYPTLADAKAWFNSTEVKVAGQILQSVSYPKQ